MRHALKRFAAHLPRTWRQDLKRFHCRRLIAKNRFDPGEPEYDLLAELVGPGDWVIDVGANIGHYTLALSPIVGREGRVIAIEPVPESLELLAANINLLPTKNVTLIGLAGSDATATVGMHVPQLATGLDNLYEAQITQDRGSLSVMTFPLDALGLPAPVRLIKIDAEGHDLQVLKGAEAMIRRDTPVLIVEDGDPRSMDFLESLGYVAIKLPNSPNHIFDAGDRVSVAAEARRRRIS